MSTKRSAASLEEPLLGKTSPSGNNSPEKQNNRSHDWMNDIERLQQQELQHQLKLGSAPKVGEIIDVTMKILNENVSICHSKTCNPNCDKKTVYPTYKNNVCKHFCLGKEKYTCYDKKRDDIKEMKEYAQEGMDLLGHIIPDIITLPFSLIMKYGLYKINKK